MCVRMSLNSVYALRKVGNSEQSVVRVIGTRGCRTQRNWEKFNDSWKGIDSLFARRGSTSSPHNSFMCHRPAQCQVLDKIKQDHLIGSVIIIGPALPPEPPQAVRSLDRCEDIFESCQILSITVSIWVFPVDVPTGEEPSSKTLWRCVALVAFPCGAYQTVWRFRFGYGASQPALDRKSVV